MTQSQILFQAIPKMLKVEHSSKEQLCDIDEFPGFPL